MNEQLKHSLQQIAADNIPDDVNLCRVVRPQVQLRQAPKANRRMLPTTRLGWAAMAMIIMLPLGAALGYRAYTTLQDLYQSDAGLQAILDGGLGQEINQSQTVDGFTFMLQQVYADANRIVIGYTISSDTLNEYDPQVSAHVSPHMTLVDQAGTELPGGDATYTAPKDGTISVIASFDASGMAQVPEEVQAAIELMQWEPVADPLEEANSHAIAGPVSFDLALQPNRDVRIVDVDQTVEAKGIALTLKQVRVTPTAAYATVCVDETDAQSLRWLSSGTLRTGAGLADRIESNRRHPAQRVRIATRSDSSDHITTSAVENGH